MMMMMMMCFNIHNEKRNIYDDNFVNIKNDDIIYIIKYNITYTQTKDGKNNFCHQITNDYNNNKKFVNVIEPKINTIYKSNHIDDNDDDDQYKIIILQNTKHWNKWKNEICNEMTISQSHYIINKKKIEWDEIYIIFFFISNNTQTKTQKKTLISLGYWTTRRLRRWWWLLNWWIRISNRKQKQKDVLLLFLWIPNKQTQTIDCFYSIVLCEWKKNLQIQSKFESHIKHCDDDDEIHDFIYQNDGNHLNKFSSSSFYSI